MKLQETLDVKDTLCYVLVTLFKMAGHTVMKKAFSLAFQRFSLDQATISVSLS